PAIADCPVPTPLTSGAVNAFSGTDAYYSFDAEVPYWTAIAVRGSGGADWNLEVDQNGSAGAPPPCFTGPLASSNFVAGMVDLVVWDFKANLYGAYYEHARSASAAAGSLEWDHGPDQIQVNQPVTERTVAGTHIVEIWDVSLEAGHDYTFTFSHTGGANL